MNKPFVPVILFYCLCAALFGFVRAAEKTLNVELAFVKAALPAGAPITAKPKVQTVLMNCVIVEDGVEFEIILGGDDLWQMTSTNSFLQVSNKINYFKNYYLNFHLHLESFFSTDSNILIYSWSLKIKAELLSFQSDLCPKPYRIPILMSALVAMRC